MKLEPIHRRRDRRGAVAPAITALALGGFALGLSPPSAQSSIAFRDATEAAGLRFTHANGATGDKHLPETMGAGVAWLDYDNDGREDLYLVQSGPLPGVPGDRANVLARNLGEAGFHSAPGGVRDGGYGMGAAVADLDGDGWRDLFVTNFGPNALYRNNGDGTFSPLPEAGVADPRWSSSAAWADLDLDGLPDLFVVNYVEYDLADALYCGEQAEEIRSYCHIDLFDGVGDTLYRNRGDGTFEDLSAAAGVDNPLDGKGLGVVAVDLDDDGLVDAYVANDTAQNFMYLNRGAMRFEDVGLFSGAGYSEDGSAQAGMGTELADLDGDGAVEILVTNFAFEPNNVFRLVAPGAYVDDTYALGVGEVSLPALGFGVVALDADADGDQDVVVANGHILDNVEQLKDNVAYAQPNHFFRNRLATLRREALAAGDLGGLPEGSAWRPARRLFEEIGAESGGPFARAEVSRGLAVGDADGDGRPDLALTNSAGPARLLRNESTGPNRRLVLRLRGRAANRDALGAVVRIVPAGGDPAVDGVAGFAQRFDVKAGSSYLSHGSTDLFVGLGGSGTAAIEITWPGGPTERIDATAGQLLLIAEGRGIVATRPLARAERP